MSNIKVDYDILNQKQTPAFYASSLATRPAFGFPGRIFIDTDTPSSGIYRDTGSAWVQVADPGAGTTGTLQQVTTNGNTTTLGISVQGIEINDGAGTGVYNLAVGNSALALNTNGEYNLAIGQNALNKNTTGQSNIAIGYVSLQNNIGGNGNTAIGNSALQTNSNGVSNTAIGFNALLSNTTGNNNTAIGVSSLALNTTGANNIAVGSSSLYANTTGGANTGIGYASLSANTTGGNNTSLGSQALKENTTASFNTAIGTASLQNNTTGASNTAIGYGSLNINTTGSTNTAVGTSALASNTTAGQNTAVGNSSMSANTTGSLNTAVGQGSMQANTTGQYNTAVGTTSLNTNTTGVNNTAVGYGALQLLTIGGGNVAIGYGSGSAITTGSNNYLLGGGQAITTGSNNTIIGSYGGTSTLANNIVLSDGQSNVRLFSDANGLIGINQAVGSTIGGQLDIHSTQTYALVLNGLSTSNAYTAFSNASVGKWRIGNTYNAGANSFDIYNLGTSSTALSFNSTTNAVTFTNDITIGSPTANATLNLSGDSGGGLTFINFKADSGGTKVQIQGEKYAGTGGILSFKTLRSSVLTTAMTINQDGRVAIGQTAPGVALSVAGQSEAWQFAVTTATGTAGALIGSPSANVLAFGDWSGNETMRIISTGEVGIGVTPTAGNKLWVKGTDSTSGNTTLIAQNSSGTNSFYVRNDSAIFFRPSYPFTTAALANMVLDSSGVIQLSVSSLKYKKDINNYNKGLNEVLKLRPVTFKSKNSLTDGDKIFAGFIAEEIDELGLSEFVIYSQDKTPNALAYSNMTALLTKAIQELNEKLVRNNIN